MPVTSPRAAWPPSPASSRVAAAATPSGSCSGTPRTTSSATSAANPTAPPSAPSSPEMEDREALIAALGQGLRPDYFFFWGHQPERDGRPGKGCLSQWWPAPFVVAGDQFATAEHFMMAGKA